VITTTLMRGSVLTAPTGGATGSAGMGWGYPVGPAVTRTAPALLGLSPVG
jgi:hypothetical protein